MIKSELTIERMRTDRRGLRLPDGEVALRVTCVAVGSDGNTGCAEVWLTAAQLAACLFQAIGDNRAGVYQEAA